WGPARWRLTGESAVRLCCASPHALGERLDQAAKGDRAMADNVFHVGGQLGRGAAAVLDEEDRIVPEPSGARGLERDSARPCAGGDDRSGILGALERDDDAMEPGGAPLGRHAVERLEQPLDVRPVVRLRSREAGGAYPGQAAEGVDGEAGV